MQYGLFYQHARLQDDVVDMYRNWHIYVVHAQPRFDFRGAFDRFWQSKSNLNGNLVKSYSLAVPNIGATNLQSTYSICGTMLTVHYVLS